MQIEVIAVPGMALFQAVSRCWWFGGVCVCVCDFSLPTLTCGCLLPSHWSLLGGVVTVVGKTGTVPRNAGGGDSPHDH